MTPYPTAESQAVIDGINLIAQGMVIIGFLGLLCFIWLALRKPPR